VVTRTPRDANVYMLNAIACVHLEDLVGAADWFSQGIRYAKGDARYYSNYSHIALQVGDVALAVDLGRRCVALDATFFEGQNHLGNALAANGDLAEAIDAFGMAVRLSPDDPTIAINLARVLADAVKSEEAEQVYLRTIATQPEFWPATANLAGHFMQQGRDAEAVARFGPLAGSQPDNPQLQMNLGLACLALGELEDARCCFTDVLRLVPNDADAHLNLAMVYERTGDMRAAAIAYRAALGSDPGLHDAHRNLLLCLLGDGAFDEAHHSAERAFVEEQWSPSLLPALIKTFGQTVDLPRRDAAWLALLATRTTRQSGAAATAEFVFSSNYYELLSIEEVYRFHRETARELELGTSPLPRSARMAGRTKLRIGYLSPDFRQHSVGMFFRPLIAHHDKQRFEIVCYANQHESDDVTRFIESHAHTFRYVVDEDDRQLADQIRADGIDVLVDLAGHTAGNRLGVFGYRCAPLQVTYLGYPNTTGLESMDSRISDPWVDVEGGTRYTEELLRMPECFLCFGAVGDSPPVSTVRDDGGFTFGSFNALEKVNSRVIQTWSQILAESPQATLLMKARGLDSVRVKENIHRAFARCGVAPERVELVGWVPSLTAHRSLYRRVDLALDTFPYHGTTTTCEALSMGVPVLSLTGTCHAQRVGFSVLHNLELGEFAPTSTDDYVSRAAHYASEPGELNAIATSLHERLRSSILGQPERFVPQLEDVLEQALD
jgi:protein O-GlcNAc transferase